MCVRFESSVAPVVKTLVNLGTWVRVTLMAQLLTNFDRATLDVANIDHQAIRVSHFFRYYS